jgi:hypothetical protein
MWLPVAIGILGALLLALPAWAGDPAGFLERVTPAGSEGSAGGGLAAAERAERRMLELRRETDEISRDIRRRHELREIEREGTRQDLERYQRRELARDEANWNIEDIELRALERRLGAEQGQNDLQRDVDRVIDAQRFKQRSDRLHHKIRDSDYRTRGDPLSHGGRR